jgi:hypothetical protein
MRADFARFRHAKETWRLASHLTVARKQPRTAHRTPHTATAPATAHLSRLSRRTSPGRFKLSPPYDIFHTGFHADSTAKRPKALHIVSSIPQYTRTPTHTIRVDVQTGDWATRQCRKCRGCRRSQDDGIATGEHQWNHCPREGERVRSLSFPPPSRNLPGMATPNRSRSFIIRQMTCRYSNLPALETQTPIRRHLATSPSSNPQSAVRSPESAIRNPQSAIHNPQSAIPKAPQIRPHRYS